MSKGVTQTKKMTVPDFKIRKKAREKLVMVTCYDSSFARILDQTTIDLLLVGDSAALMDTASQGFYSKRPSHMRSCCAAKHARAFF
jgi:ketopantoate hydroxymethyltransferase